MNDTSMPQSGKEAYETKKAEKKKMKEKARKSASARGIIKKIFIVFAAALIAGAIGYGALRWARSRVPGEDFSRAIPDMGRSHVPTGTVAEYNSNPPTSGPHYAEWAKTGCRERAIPDGHIVHSLEHGAVWISYHPRVESQVREALCDFAGGFVIVTPREANDTDIALAAWGRLDTFNLEGGVLTDALRNRIRDFITRYQNRGPERVNPSVHATGV